MQKNKQYVKEQLLRSIRNLKKKSTLLRLRLREHTNASVLLKGHRATGSLKKRERQKEAN